MLNLAELVPKWSMQEIAEAEREGIPKKIDRAKKIMGKLVGNPDKWEKKFFEMGLNRDEFEEHLRPPSGLTSAG
jgi:hypothetical protein